MQHIVKERKDMNLKENKEGNKKKIDVGAFFFFWIWTCLYDSVSSKNF